MLSYGNNSTVGSYGTEFLKKNNNTLKNYFKNPYDRTEKAVQTYGIEF